MQRRQFVHDALATVDVAEEAWVPVVAAVEGAVGSRVVDDTQWPSAGRFDGGFNGFAPQPGAPAEGAVAFSIHQFGMPGSDTTEIGERLAAHLRVEPWVHVCPVDAVGHPRPPAHMVQRSRELSGDTPCPKEIHCRVDTLTHSAYGAATLAWTLTPEPGGSVARGRGDKHVLFPDAE